MLTARVYVTLKPAVNAAQSQTVLGGLHSLGYDAVADVRIGKYLEIRLAGADPDPAPAAIAGICHRLLANPVIEEYRYTVEPAEPAGIPGDRPADAGRAGRRFPAALPAVRPLPARVENTRSRAALA